MYTPTPFKQEDESALAALVGRVGLATLVTETAGGLAVSHVPFVLVTEDGRWVLRGHLARANPDWRRFRADREAVAIFLGPQAYVTPQWYPAKAEHGRVVPTWNYAAVHAHGTLRVIEEAGWLHAQVTALTQRHESRFARPWAVNDAPAEYIEKMLSAIVGIELAVARFEGKWKLSQNRAAPDRAGVRDGLARGDEASRAVAAMMECPT